MGFAVRSAARTNLRRRAGVAVVGAGMPELSEQSPPGARPSYRLGVKLQPWGRAGNVKIEKLRKMRRFVAVQRLACHRYRQWREIRTRAALSPFRAWVYWLIRTSSPRPG